MKKLTFLSLFALISLASCRKDYACSCIVTQTEDGDSYSYTDVSILSNVTKPEAKTRCSESQQTLSFGAGSSLSSDCTLIEK